MVYYDKSEYVETATGNKVNRKSRLFGSQNIVLNGKVSCYRLFDIITRKVIIDSFVISHQTDIILIYI